MMKYRRLGRTGLNVSLMGLGSGGPSSMGQATGVPEAEAHRVIRRALDLGINLIDTAAGYRDSEAILGRGLRGVSRQNYVLCTKAHVRQLGVGQVGNEPLITEVDLVASLTRSLQRLNTDHIDVFQLHAVPPELYQAVRDRFVPVLRKQQEAGSIRFLGLSEYFSGDHRHEALARVLEDDIFDTIMVGYNLLSPSPEAHVLPEALRKDIGVLVMCAIHRTIAHPDRLAELIAELKTRGAVPADALPDSGPLDWLIHDDVESIAAAAYKFAAEPPAVSSVLTGTANVEHLEANVRAILGPPLPPADRRRLLDVFGPVGRNLSAR